MKIINKYVVDVYKVSFKAFNDTFKSVFKFLGIKSLMNKLSLKEYIYSVMIQNNEECLYVTTSEVQEIVEDELNSIDIHDSNDVEDIVRNMDIKYEFEIMDEYEVNDKICDALDDFKREQSPFTEDDERQLKAEITKDVIEVLEAKKSPTIKEVEASMNNIKKASKIVLELALKKESKLNVNDHQFILHLLNNYVQNGGAQNMK